MPVVETVDLQKRYRKIQALAGVSLVTGEQTGGYVVAQYCLILRIPTDAMVCLHGNPMQQARRASAVSDLSRSRRLLA